MRCGGGILRCVSLGAAFWFAPACSRTPAPPLSSPTRDAGDAAGDAGAASTDPGQGSGSDARDGPEGAADPADPCVAERMLAGLPASLPGWTQIGDPVVYPFETIRGVPVRFVGRVFRREGTCVTVAAARPEAASDLWRNLVRAAGMENVRDAQPPRLTRSSPEANQVTVWLLPRESHLVMVRGFGTTDAAVLTPFVDALALHAYDALAEPVADSSSDSSGATYRETGGGAGCTPLPPVEDPFGPGAMWGPPAECLAPPPAS